MSKGRKPAPPPGRWALQVSDAVRREIGSRRISLRELAELTGISRSYLSSRLSDKQALSFNDVQIITESLGLPDNYFFNFIAEEAGQEKFRSETHRGVELEYVSHQEAKKLTGKFERNEKGEITQRAVYGLAARKGDPRLKEFLSEQDEAA